MSRYTRSHFGIRVSIIATLLGTSTTLLSGPAYSAYIEQNLVSDLPGVANIVDPNLVNPWGMSSSPTSPIWVSDNGTGLATLYNGIGQPQPLVVTISRLILLERHSHRPSV